MKIRTCLYFAMISLTLVLAACSDSTAPQEKYICGMAAVSGKYMYFPHDSTGACVPR